MLHRNSAQRLGQSFLSLYGGSGLQVSRCDKAHTRVLERSRASCKRRRLGEPDHLTQYLLTKYLLWGGIQGWLCSRDSHKPPHTLYGKENTSPEVLSKGSKCYHQAGLELGAEGIPEAEEGVGQYPNKVLKISFRRPQSS